MRSAGPLAPAAGLPRAAAGAAVRGTPPVAGAAGERQRVGAIIGKTFASTTLCHSYNHIPLALLFGFIRTELLYGFCALCPIVQSAVHVPH